MLRRHISGLSDLGNKKNVVSVILVCNAFVWYFSVLSSLESISPGALVWVIHFSALILSALAGASFGKQIERPKFLILWMIAGVLSSTMLFALSSNTPEVLVILVSLFLGLSLGLGMPACMSYFSDNSAVENRGRVSGVIMLATGIGIAAFGLAPANDFFRIGVILAIWRFSGLLVFLWAKDYRITERKMVTPSYKQVFGQHSFVLYFVPWLMFSLVNYLATPMIPNNANYPAIGLVQTVFMGAAAVVGGIFADSMGRKRISIAAFVLLGLGAAVLGFSGNNLSQMSYLVPYFNAGIDGVAWGFLLVLFVLALWGDLSHNSSSDKYYALGVMPFFISKFLELTVGQYLPESVTSSSALFSFAAFFLFLAVLPLFYAPETLPEKVMKDLELKTYLKKAKEIAAKAQEKEEEEDSPVEFAVAQEYEEEAERLAEKCY
jgi:MFS family permease